MYWLCLFLFFYYLFFRFLILSIDYYLLSKHPKNILYLINNSINLILSSPSSNYMRFKLSQSTLSLISTWLANIPFLYPVYLFLHIFIHIIYQLLRRTFLRSSLQFFISFYDPFFFLISLLLSLFHLLLSHTTKRLLNHKTSLVSHKIHQNYTIFINAIQINKNQVTSPSISSEWPTSFTPPSHHSYSSPLSPHTPLPSPPLPSPETVEYEVNFKIFGLFLGVMSFIGLLIVNFLTENWIEEGWMGRESMFLIFGLIYSAQILKNIYGGIGIGGFLALTLPMGYGIMKSWTEILEILA